MFRFANSEYFYLLLLIPLMGLLYWVVRRRYYKRLELFGNIDTIGQLMPDASWNKMKYKFLMITTAFIFMVFALARPQMGAKLREVKQSGIELMFVIDVSNSMLADDYQPSRLERTKNAVNTILDKSVNDRIGIIVFAGRAFVQLPITSDYVAAKRFVDYISPQMIEQQGTNLTEALELVERSFSSQSEGSRAVILISDGEDHSSDPLKVAERLAEDGVIINTIGIGTPSGVALQIDGTPVSDQDGKIVVTKLNEDILKKIALTSGGTYIKASNSSVGVDEIIAQLRTMDSTDFSTSRFESYNELYQYFLALGLVFILLEFLILERRNRVLNRMKLFNIEKK